MLRDELHEPLGLGTRPRAGGKGAVAVLAAAAALVAAGIAAGEASRLRALPFRNAVVAARPSAAADPAAPSVTASIAPPAKPAARTDASDKAESAAKPARDRAGAPEPLIIDVQQALAALKARGAPPTQR